jgi:hypothetical protein
MVGDSHIQKTGGFALAFGEFQFGWRIAGLETSGGNPLQHSRMVMGSVRMLRGTFIAEHYCETLLRK